MRLDSDTAFFKALENVQGEECDQLIISLGYGKNENGEFHMRFGPMNSKWYSQGKIAKATVISGQSTSNTCN